ncbi:MAG: hypothetical protein WCF88_00845 [Candidatus Acidiferrales bacterium]|jgi:hypothetical protein
MRLLKQAFGGLGALAVLAVVVAFIAPKTAHALAAALVQIVPGTTTHVGQNESQLVSLLCNNENGCYSIDPAGGISSLTTYYTVPTGYTLIITDWEWESRAIGGFASDGLLNKGTNAGLVNSQTIVPSGAGAGFVHEHYLTGIRVGSGVQLVDLSAVEGFGESDVQGYLVPND